MNTEIIKNKDGTETHIFYWNSIKNRLRYKNGVRHGLSKSWYLNGQICFSGRYVNGKEHGIHIGYYESGHLCEKVRYFHGKKNGLCEYWHPGGVLWFREKYKAGKLLHRETYDITGNKI